MPDEPVGNRFLEPDVDQLVQVLHHRVAAEQLDHVGGVQARVGPENKACSRKKLRNFQASGRKKCSEQSGMEVERAWGRAQRPGQAENKLHAQCSMTLIPEIPRIRNLIKLGL